MDDVAERLLALDQMPVANLKKVLGMSTVEEREDEPISSEDVAQLLTEDVEKWIQGSKEIVALAEEAGDGATADQFNDYLTEYQKLQWMLKSYSN